MATRKTKSVSVVSEPSERELELQKQLAEVQSRLNLALSTGSTPQGEVKPSDYVRIMSLCPYTLTLATKRNGSGKEYSFDSFGQTKNILYVDLMDILEVNFRFAEQGYFYILNKDVVRLHGLEDAYTKILSKESIETVLAMNDSEKTIKLFESATDYQKEMITDSIINRIANDEKVDMNVVSVISRLSDVNIIEKAKEAKEYAAMR